jgi:protein TonB
MLTSALPTVRLVPITASLAIHVVLVTAALVIVDATLPRESVFMLELTDLDSPATPAARTAVAPAPTAPPAPVRRPPPPKPKRTPPSSESAMPREPLAPRVEPPPPALAVVPPAPAVAPLTPPVALTPSAPATPAPAAPTAPTPSPPATVTTPVFAALAPPAAGPSGALASAVPAPDASGSRSVPADRRDGASSAPRGPSGGAAAIEGLTQLAIPRFGYQYWPRYPRSARDRQVEGTTLLGVFVAADGRVTDVVVKESAGHPDLDRAAADAVRRWRFEPARRGTQAVAEEVELPFRWRLER